MIDALQGNQPPIRKRRCQPRRWSGKVPVPERHHHRIGENCEVTFLDRFFSRSSQYGSERSCIVVCFVADLSEDPSGDVTRFGTALQAGEDLLGTRRIVRKEHTVADSRKDDGAKGLRGHHQGTQQRDGPQRKTHRIDRTVGGLRCVGREMRQEMLRKLPILLGIVWLRCRPVTGEVVGDDRSTGLLDEVDESGASPRVIEGACPAVHEKHRSHVSHGG